MSKPNSADVDETARIILLDCAGLKEFAFALRGEFPTLTLPEVVDYWSKYRGMDGRILPTHDVLTGRPVR